MAAVSRKNGNLTPGLAGEARIVIVLNHAPHFENPQPSFRIGGFGLLQVLREGIDCVRKAGGLAIGWDLAHLGK